MPYVSDAQRGWMHIHEPEIAKRWDKEIHDKKARGQMNFDLGIDDVHTPSVPGKTRTMAELTTRARKKIPTGQFADPKNRRYPIHDKAHADNAAARLEQRKGSEPNYSAIKARIKAAQRRFGEKTQKLALSIDHPQHGHIEVYRMDAKGLEETLWLLRGLEFNGLQALKGVWIQIAKQGKFFKDNQFFEMNDQTFSDIIRNFESSENKRIPVDFEHASEMNGSAGTIPFAGAPAQGWITALKTQGGNLWGQVEWGDLAEQYIKNGNYKFISPAIRFGCKDAHSNKPIGAKLTSAGLVNIPFLDGMKPLVAKDDQDGAAKLIEFISEHYAQAMPVEERTIRMSGRVVSSSEYMPKLKACLKMDPLATAAECKDQLSRLQEHFMAANGDINAKPQGVDIGSHMMGLREMVGAHAGMTWDDVFAIVEDMIDEAMEEHEEKYHGAAPDDDDETPDPEDIDIGDVQAAITDAIQEHEQEEHMSAAPVSPNPLDHVDETLKDANTSEGLPSKTNAEETTMATEALEVQLKNTENDKNKLELQLKELGAQLADALAKLTTAGEEIKTLKDEQSKRNEKDLGAEVDAVILAYGKSKGVKAEDKPALLKFLKACPEDFRSMYKPVDPSKLHLMSAVTTEAGNAPGKTEPAPGTVEEIPDQKKLVAKHIAEGKTLEQAVSLAYTEVTKALAQHSTQFARS